MQEHEAENLPDFPLQRSAHPTLAEVESLNTYAKVFQNAVKDKSLSAAMVETVSDIRSELGDITRRVIQDSKLACREKVQMESKMSNFVKSKRALALWKMAQRKIKFWNIFGRDIRDQKLFGIRIELTRLSPERIYKLISEPDMQPTPKKIKKPLILYNDSQFLRYWNMTMILLVVYNVIMAPLTLSLINDSTGPLYWVDLLINIFFACDVLINFCIALEGDQDDRWLIAKTYGLGWFAPDVISIFPFNWLTAEVNEAYILLTKIPRFFRLFRMAKLIRMHNKARMNKTFKHILEKISPTFLKLMEFLVTMVVIIHISGCLWLFVASISTEPSRTWVANSKITKDYQDDSLRLYIASIYWAIATIATVGYGDITPKTNEEKLFTIGWMMVGVGFYSYTVSTLSSLMLDSNSG